MVSDYDGRTYLRIQILSAQDLMDAKPVRMPPSRTAVFAQSARERNTEGTQGRLG